MGPASVLPLDWSATTVQHHCGDAHQWPDVPHPTVLQGLYCFPHPLGICGPHTPPCSRDPVLGGGCDVARGPGIAGPSAQCITPWGHKVRAVRRGFYQTWSHSDHSVASVAAQISAEEPSPAVDREISMKEKAFGEGVCWSPFWGEGSKPDSSRALPCKPKAVSSLPCPSMCILSRSTWIQ